MSRVSLMAGLMLTVLCWSLPSIVAAQSEGGYPEESASGGGPSENGESPTAGAEYEGTVEFGPEGAYGVAAVSDTPQTEDRPFAGSANEPSHAAHQQASAADRITKVLNSRLKSPLQFEAQPLNELINVLQTEYDIPIVIDQGALDEVAISPETEVSVNLRDISLRSALNLILRQPGLENLTFLIDEEVLLITTQEKANERLVVEVYRVDDLIRGTRQESSRSENPYSSLVQVITKSVEYDTWMEHGSGEGEALLMQPGLLVVTQTRRVHDEIGKLLQKLRSVRAEIDGERGSGRGYGREGRQDTFGGL